MTLLGHPLFRLSCIFELDVALHPVSVTRFGNSNSISNSSSNSNSNSNSDSKMSQGSFSAEVTVTIIRHSDPTRSPALSSFMYFSSSTLHYTRSPLQDSRLFICLSYVIIDNSDNSKYQLYKYFVSVIHPVSITRFPSFRTQTLENLSHYL